MKLKQISIDNFRCFKSVDISFADNVTILFGKNGSGKSSLLSAIKISMSFIFSKYKSPNKSLELLGNTPDLHVANVAKTDALFDNENLIYKYPLSIKSTARYIDSDLTWSIYKGTANGKLSETKYREAFLSFTRMYNSDLKKSLLPVYAFFSDSYPHKKINIGTFAQSVLKGGTIPRAFAYYQWDAEANCAEIWQNRYISQYSKINDYKNTEAETRNERKEIDFVDSKVKLFTEILDAKYQLNQEFSVKKIVLERLKDEKSISMKFHFNDAREIFFEHLPQGYNRLISIVFDVAYRSYLLNGDCEPEGIVLIDEVELHLHPSLQQEVLQRFKKTFPNIQFIVSTHSPLVLSNLKTDGTQSKIVKLENDGLEYSNQKIENIYGIDYTTGLMEVMDVQYRQSTIDNLIDSYIILKLRNREADALHVWNEIFSIVGKDNKHIEKEIADKLAANS